MTTPAGPPAPEDQPGWGAPPPPGAPPRGGPAAPGPTPYGLPGQYGGAPQLPSGAGGDPAGRRPGTVTAAAVTGIAVGGLSSLFGLLGLAAASSLDVDVRALDVVLTLLGVLVAVGLIAGGVQLLRTGVPTLLLRAGYAVCGLWLLSIVANLAAGNGFAGGGQVSLVAAAVVIGLLTGRQAREWFAARNRAG